MQSQQQIGVIYNFTGMDEKIIYKIEILQLIESKYNIEIKDEEVENIITFEDLIYELHLLKHLVTEAAKGNQEYRIDKIVNALDIFIMKEYNKYRG